ncbi:MAG: NAD(P)/FAD-dependent oxidoreductase [Ignavibacteriales bacterium]|nr:NAD(P)/FAD-dependent oxidoreductase [Ignavibacteriales bacterium]
MKNEYDVVVVGAGPSGSVAARYAAQKGASVLMLEKDRDIGLPVRCGEACSQRSIEPFINTNEKWISARVNKYSFVAPNGKCAVVPFKETVLILDRKVFDYELAKLAAKEGVEIFTKTYVKGLLFDNNKVAGVTFEAKGKTFKIKSKIVIGADGVESRVGRWAGLRTYVNYKDMGSCVQVVATNINIESDTCIFYLGTNYAEGGYVWVFPKGHDIANIGVGITGETNKKKNALSFLKEFFREYFPDGKILSSVAGGSPTVPTLKKISAPGIMLVGDAARQVNPLSGGGIGTGMLGGSIAGKLSSIAIERNNLDLILKYDKEWYKVAGKRHIIFDKIKNEIYKFDDEKYNQMEKTINKIPENKRTLARLFSSALINHPGMVKDVVKVFVKK